MGMLCVRASCRPTPGVSCRPLPAVPPQALLSDKLALAALAERMKQRMRHIVEAEDYRAVMWLFLP